MTMTNIYTSYMSNMILIHFIYYFISLNPPLHWSLMGDITEDNNHLFLSLLELHFHMLAPWQARTEEAPAK